MAGPLTGANLRYVWRPRPGRVREAHSNTSGPLCGRNLVHATAMHGAARKAKSGAARRPVME
ncbi:protein of unknown function [Paraburkholderia dioscoreae]|uniref:Uncharacterized protein n=1 Tax=Paraburkholderia dioscoreae TaxID=2604047 RepID=A0A5Q4ZST4_9BURK|nr:protein of unknown function [Paraburkholderia dioscoreae]